MLVVSSAFFWSLSGVLVKSPPLAALPSETRGLALACYRALFAGLCLLPFVNWRHARWRRGLIPLLASFAAMNLLFITAMTQTTAAAAIFLQYTSSLWACLFAVVVLGERLSRGDWWALTFVAAGIAWIVISEWSGANFRGNLTALASGLCYTGVILCLRMLKAEDSAWLIALCHLVSGLILLPAMFWIEVTLVPSQWGLIAILGCVQMALPYVMYARGVGSVSVREASLLPLMEPILNPLWVLLFWGESPALSTWVGGGLILGGLLFRYVAPRQ